MFRLFKKKKPVEETKVIEETKDEQIEASVEQEAQQSIDTQTTDSLTESKDDSSFNAEDASKDPNSSTVLDEAAETANQSQPETDSLEQVLAEKVPEQQHVNAEIAEANNAVTDQQKNEEKNQEVNLEQEVAPAPEAATPKLPEAAIAIPKEKPKKEGLFDRLKSGLSKTGSTLTEGMGALVLGKKKIDDDVLEELETRLLMSDVGIEATQRIIDDLTKRTSRNELSDYDALMTALYEEMVKILRPVAKPLDLEDIDGPAVILLVGINGAGKTTTIGKMAKQFQNEGKSVMLAAGDTFRAAAVEQLQVWGERNDIPVIAQGTGADSASVIYDAMESAKAKKIDVLLADTAGRLHTQTNLMEELKKVKRVMQKIDTNAPHEVMLIVDASIGQNALAQATEFNAALGVTGITVTKLDGTAKGGILFAMAEKTGIPVRFIGVGESIDDLQEFDAYEFAGALLAEDE
jgi:fused signal recognition particle receptor